MRREVLIIFGLLSLGGVTLLFWFGHTFWLYNSLHDGLDIAPLQKQNLSLGESVTFDLSGYGFDEQTSVSLFPNVKYSEAVIGTFPLDGIYTEGLRYGDYLYLARVGGGIQVLDIRQPQKPHLIQEYLAGRSIVDIHRDGDTLYCSCGKQGVTVMKIVAAGHLEYVRDILPELTVLKTFFVDGFLYVATGVGGVAVYDVSSAEPARFVCQVTRCFSSDFVVSQQVLYTPTATGDISIFTIDEPSNPHFVYLFSAQGIVHDLSIHQHHLYLAIDTGVSEYSLINPIRPTLTNQWRDFGSPEKIFSGEKYVYVSDGFSGFRIIKPKSDGSPDFINLNVDPRIIVEKDNCLYVAGSNCGVLILDNNSLQLQSPVKTINTPGNVRDLLIRGQRLYIADGRSGLLVKNFSADSPFTFLSPRYSRSLLKWNDLLFVALRPNGIEVLDISDPEKTETLFVWPDISAQRLAVSGHYLVVSRGFFGVDLFDIQDMNHPVKTGYLADVQPLGFAVYGGQVYIASKQHGLLIYRISANGHFQHLGQSETPFPMNHFDLGLSLQVKDGIAYMANGRSGLLIVDVTRPKQPIILSSTAIPGVCKDIKVKNGFAYISSQSGGMSVVDVTNLRNPRRLNTFPIHGLSRGLAIADGRIYVAHNTLGVTVIPTPLLKRKIDVLSSERARVTFSSPESPGDYNLEVISEKGRVSHTNVVRYH